MNFFFWSRKYVYFFSNFLLFQDFYFREWVGVEESYSWYNPVPTDEEGNIEPCLIGWNDPWSKVNT